MYPKYIPHRSTIVGDEEFLFFGGTAYLGMHARSEFAELVKQGIDLYGTNYGASRLGNVSIPVFEEAENKLADFIGAQSALLVSSGTLAGRLILEVLGDEYTYHFAPNAHIAINPPYKVHAPQTFGCSIEDTLDSIHLSPHDKHVITMNTVDALTASTPDLDWVKRLPNNKDVILVIDDSHGIGVMGEMGMGWYKRISMLHSETIMICSLGKAMGLPAGLIAGPVKYIAKAKRHPLFGGSSPMIPAYAYAYIHADEVYRLAYQQLIWNIEYFKTNNPCMSFFKYSEQFPIFCTNQTTIASYLETHHIKISQFRYPSQHDPLYTRIVLNALHTKEDLDFLMSKLKDYK